MTNITDKTKIKAKLWIGSCSIIIAFALFFYDYTKIISIVAQIFIFCVILGLFIYGVFDGILSTLSLLAMIIVAIFYYSNKSENYRAHCSISLQNTNETDKQN
jgi:CHASE2 domain-containing sensor protein